MTTYNVIGLAMMFGPILLLTAYVLYTAAREIGVGFVLRTVVVIAAIIAVGTLYLSLAVHLLSL